MAKSACPNEYCHGSHFEGKLATLAGTAGRKLFLVQCANCGTVVGTSEVVNGIDYLGDIHKGVKQLCSKMNVFVNWLS